MNCWRWIYRKVSEEQSYDNISQKETTEQKLVDKQDSKKDAHRRAFLQHALIVGLMQLLREASRESNQKLTNNFGHGHADAHIHVHTLYTQHCRKPFVGLYLDSRSISYQKQKTKVKLWWVCTGIAGGYSVSTGPERSKNTKNVAILKSSSLWNENTSDTDRKSLLLLSTDSRRPCPLIFKLLSVFVW